MPVVVFVLYLLVGAVEIPPLVEKHQLKPVALYIVLLGGALIVSELLLFDVDIPSPAGPINQFALWVKSYLGG